MKKPIIPLLFIACLFMAACHNFEDPKQPAFITNAKILENWETLSPGSIIHMEGNGYQVINP